MNLFQGFAELQTPWDLVRKLEYDLVRLENLPQDQYAAFDFFVTADHIVDWIHPANRTKRTKVRSSSPLLKITSHIANGAKHFKATANHHRSVTDVEKYRIIEPGYVEEGYFEEPLIVHLTAEEEKSIGQATIEAVQLAKLVLEYWRTNAPKP
jgi:hypothetical protein